MADETDLERSLSAASKPAKPVATKVAKRDEVRELAPDAAANAQSPKSITAPTAPPRSAISNVAKAAMPTQHKAAAVKAAEIADQFSCDTAMRLAFVGAGQGGGKIAQAFWNIGYRRVSAFNTTDSDFAGLDLEMPKMSLDIGGAAKDMQMARNAMRGRDEEIRDLFSRGWGKKFDCAIVCVGLGGGSGSGAALPLVELARKFMEAENLPVRVGAIVALPSVDEGQQAARNAVTAFQELHAAGVSPLIIIDNDKVDDLYRPPMSRLLPMSNELVSSLLHLFNQLAATRSQHITFDRAEFAQLLDGGIAVMGSADFAVAEITNPSDISTKIREELAKNVLADIDLRTGKTAACVFVASHEILDTFGKEYFAAGFTALNRIVGSAYPEGTAVVVHRGLYPESSEGLQCYTMISNLAPPAAKLQALARQAGLPAKSASNMATHMKVD